MEVKIYCNYCLEGEHIKNVDLGELGDFYEVEGDELVIKFLNADDTIRFPLEGIVRLMEDNNLVVRRKNKKPR